MIDRPRRKPLLLMILDGWGYREEQDGNAIAMADTPCWDKLWGNDPHCLIETSGEAVGLPAGQMGNSEVGHMNIGAGRIVFQDFSRIENAIADESFFANPVLCAAIDAAAESGGSVHIMGLLSPGGVHSHTDHFLATVRLAATRGARAITVHAFLDGRDTPPRSADGAIASMQELLDAVEGASFGTVAGRYYAMDRDKRWDRVEKAYRAIALGAADHRAASALQALEQAYERGENDEFVQPTVIGSAPGVQDGDTVIFVNFRADRARELTMAFVSEPFDGFTREKPNLAAFVCMTEYMAGLPVSVAYPPDTLPRLLGEMLADRGLTARLVEAIHSGKYDVIVCNVANPDMVGHTGFLDAAIEAVGAVDECLAAVSTAIDAVGGEMLITADHGNIEQMTDLASGQAHTAHTTNAVPLVFHGRPARMASKGSLRDLAPTMLTLLGLPQPPEMTGHPLLEFEGEAG